MKKGVVSQGQRPVDRGYFLKRNYFNGRFSKDYREIITTAASTG
jgi:hypothetical protein